jgi:hypothetical protein
MPLALVHMFMIYTFGLRIVKKLKKDYIIILKHLQCQRMYYNIIRRKMSFLQLHFQQGFSIIIIKCN